MAKKNYEYLNMIGKGGFGKVWRVRHKTTGAIFALK
jgi:serine/threonine protein kinase